MTKYRIQFDIGKGYIPFINPPICNPFEEVFIPAQSIQPLVDIECEAESQDDAWVEALRLLDVRMQGKDYTILYWYWIPVEQDSENDE